MIPTTNGRVIAQPNHQAKPARAVEAPLETVSTVNGNHDQRGRFTQGNKAACGNPHARRMARLRSAFLDSLPVERIGELAGKLMELALAGDVAAAKLVLSYALGRPVEVVNPDRLDLDEIALLLKKPTQDDVWRLIADREENLIHFPNDELARTLQSAIRSHLRAFILTSIEQYRRIRPAEREQKPKKSSDA
jgi:hypothetical protein